MDWYHNDEDAFKAVQVNAEAATQAFAEVRVSKPAAEPLILEKQATLGFALPSAEQIWCPRTVDLEVNDSQLVYAVLLEHLKQTQKSLNTEFKPNEAEKEVRGFVWDDAKFSNYKMQLFKATTGNIGVSCSLLAGHAHSLQGLWDSVTGEFRRRQLYVDLEMDELDAESDFELEEDSEYSGLGLDAPLSMDLFRFLNLPAEPSVLDDLIADLAHPKHMTNTMLLLAHNAENQANKEVMQPYAQKLVNSIVECLALQVSSLPIVRSSALLVRHLAQQGGFQLTKEQFLTIMTAVMKWSIEGFSANTKDVTVSETTTEAFIAAIPSLLSAMQAKVDAGAVASHVKKIPDCFPENQQLRAGVQNVLQSLSVC